MRVGRGCHKWSARAMGRCGVRCDPPGDGRARRESGRLHLANGGGTRRCCRRNRVNTEWWSGGRGDHPRTCGKGHPRRWHRMRWWRLWAEGKAEEGGKVAQGLGLLDAKGRDGGTGGGILKGGNEIKGSTDSSIGRRVFGHGHLGWQELDGATDASTKCPGDIDGVAPVVLGCISDVPAIDSMGCPACTLLWCFVQDDLGTQGGEGGPIEIKGAVEVFGGRESWIEAGRA